VENRVGDRGWRAHDADFAEAFRADRTHHVVQFFDELDFLLSLIFEAGTAAVAE